MPVKILLADKSITIQKVVEMLFSGKEYEVTCVSDGDSAFSEASRIVPDVVLADVDLPRIDGYAFAGRLRETPALAKVPVILMLSRDDVYDAMKGKLAGLADNIAKPFESQELIGKVKKALLAAPPAAPAPASKPSAEAAVPPKPAAVPAPPPKPVVAPPPPSQPKPVAAPPPPQPAVEPVVPPKPVAAPPSPAPPAAPAPVPSAGAKEAVPTDIFDIIEEAPAEDSETRAPKPQVPEPEAAVMAAAPEEETFEVEPEYEVEPELEPAPEMPAEKALQETADAFDTDKLFGRAPMPAEEALSAAAQPAAEAQPPATESFPTFDFSEPLPAEAEEALPLGQRAVDEMREGLGLGDEAAFSPDKHPDIVSFESLDMASRASHEDYTFAPPEQEFAPLQAEPEYAAAAAPAAETRPAPSLRIPDVSVEMPKGISQESLEKALREVLERVAWEVIPDLAERLIREEIERLKAETQ